MTGPLIAFLVRSNCGDYYCGCGGGHVVGIALTEEDAVRLKAEAESATVTYGGTKTPRNKWIHGVSIDRLPVNELLSGDE